MSPTILDKKSHINIADLRRRYTKKGLIEEDLPDDPIILFKNWFQEAVHSEVIEPNAMALATVNPENLPNVRTVLLKGIQDHSI
ncbi:MAG: pyridoxamine 5'-phosphate oxidase family protein, partial [Balneolaceae bacterium]